MPDSARIPLDRVMVRVVDINKSVVREREIDYSDYASRVWLARHCVWAWSNGYIVETYNLRNGDIA